MKNKTKLHKRRNEFVVQLIKRGGAGAGAHQKSKKAIRRQSKVDIKKQDYQQKVA